MGMSKFVCNVRVLFLARFAAMALGMVTAAALGTAAMAQPSESVAPANPPAVSQPAAPVPAAGTPAAPLSEVAPVLEASGASVIARAVLPRDLSPWGMFLNADIVVKVVMVGLVFA